MKAFLTANAQGGNVAGSQLECSSSEPFTGHLDCPHLDSFYRPHTDPEPTEYFHFFYLALSFSIFSGTLDLLTRAVGTERRCAKPEGI